MDFCGGNMQKKIPPPKKKRKKVRHPKTKNRWNTTPPPPPPKKITSQTKTSAAKSTNKSGRQTSKRTPGFLRLRRFTPGGVFRAWVLGHFWLPLGMVQAPMLKYTCDLSVAACGRGARLLRTLSDVLKSKVLVLRKWPE